MKKRIAVFLLAVILIGAAVILCHGKTQAAADFWDVNFWDNNNKHYYSLIPKSSNNEPINMQQARFAYARALREHRMQDSDVMRADAERAGIKFKIKTL